MKKLSLIIGLLSCSSLWSMHTSYNKEYYFYSAEERKQYIAQEIEELVKKASSPSASSATIATLQDTINHLQRAKGFTIIEKDPFRLIVEKVRSEEETLFRESPENDLTRHLKQVTATQLHPHG